MAHCANCVRAITYGQYWRGATRNWGRNALTRSKLSPIVTCPHCQCDNVQAFASAAIQVVVFVAGGALVMVEAGDWLLADSSALILVMVPLFALLDVLWWSFGAQLRRY